MDAHRMLVLTAMLMGCAAESSDHSAEAENEAPVEVVRHDAPAAPGGPHRSVDLPRHVFGETESDLMPNCPADTPFVCPSRSDRGYTCSAIACPKCLDGDCL